MHFVRNNNAHLGFLSNLLDQISKDLDSIHFIDKSIIINSINTTKMRIKEDSAFDAVKVIIFSLPIIVKTELYQKEFKAIQTLDTASRFITMSTQISMGFFLSGAALGTLVSLFLMIINPYHWSLTLIIDIGCLTGLPFCVPAAKFCITSFALRAFYKYKFTRVLKMK